MKYIVFWVLVTSRFVGADKVIIHDEFMQPKGWHWIRKVENDSAFYEKGFDTKAQADDFVKRLGEQCKNCVFLKLDSVIVKK